MIEGQIALLLKALRLLAERGALTVEVNHRVSEAFNRRAQSLLQGSVWNSGRCRSWYLDHRGRNTAIYPGFTWQFLRDVDNVDESHFEFDASVPPVSRSGRVLRNCVASLE